MLGRQAADLFQEGAAEGSHIGIAAGIGDLSEGQVRITHQETGSGDAAGVDEMAEIDVQLFSEEVGQVR